MLPIVAPQKEVLFKFAGPIPKNFFLQTNTLESEHLAVGDGSFAVYWVITIHPKVQVFARGFNMQLSSDLGIFEVDGCV